MRKTYPSDITREQFEVIRGTLEGAKKKTHPPDYELYEIFRAILYRKRESCRRRSIPRDFPKWQNCYCHYNEWRKTNGGEESILDRVMRELVESERIVHGRELTKTTMIIVDSKIIKNTDVAEEKGFDAVKKLQA